MRDNQPQEYDAVLGNQTTPPVNGVVLGGLEGLKKRLLSASVEQGIAAITEALPYGEAGVNVVIQMSIQNLLVARKWRAADQATTAVMLRVCDRDRKGFLRVEDVENFPCECLRMIDQLWLESSNGHFGFSVQAHIWHSIGGTPDPDWNAWCRFGESIGWYIKDSWLHWNDVTFDLNAPVGHLPRSSALIGWGLGDFWTGCRMLSAVASRLESCEILKECDRVSVCGNAGLGFR